MRDLTEAQEAAIRARVARWAHLARFSFKTMTLYMNDQSLGFSIFFEDVPGSGVENEFLGAGGLGAVRGFEDTTELKAHTLNFALSGIRDEDIALVLTEKVQGRRVMVWRALFDADHRVIGPPFLVFSGRMNTLSLNRTAEGKQTAQLSVADRLADWTRSAQPRFNDNNHRARHPGDMFFEYTTRTSEMEILWGRQ